MIPKTIHYCWFNDTPIPYSLQVCMDSWKKNLPDYKWKLWSLKDFDVNSLSWTKEACKHSKKCTFYTLRFGCSFAAVNTIKPQLL